MLLQLPIKSRFSEYVVNATTDVEPVHKNVKYTDNYIGKRFGNLVVIAYPVSKKGIRLGGAICKCDCGEYKSVNCMSALFNGTISHCDKCSRKARSESAKRRWQENPTLRLRGKYYKYRNERLYKVWCGIKQRCGKQRGYEDVSICDEWLDYIAFREWAYSHGYNDKAARCQCSIDRINPFGNYEPSNCRFVSPKVQALNKRKRWAQMDEETRMAMLETIQATN